MLIHSDVHIGNWYGQARAGWDMRLQCLSRGPWSRIRLRCGRLADAERSSELERELLALHERLRRIQASKPDFDVSFCDSPEDCACARDVDDHVSHSPLLRHAARGHDADHD